MLPNEFGVPVSRHAEDAHVSGQEPGGDRLANPSGMPGNDRGCIGCVEWWHDTIIRGSDTGIRHMAIVWMFLLAILAACGRAADRRPAVDVDSLGRSTMANSSAAKTPVSLSLTSPAFRDGSAIPTQFTCDGADRSPALTWSGASDGTASYALIVEDPDAPSGTFIHWVLYDVPANVHSLPEGVAKGPTVASLGGARQGQTGFKGTPGYGGPCPPKGPAHHYHFRLFALDKLLGLAPGASREDVVTAMRGHELARGELVGTYARQR